MNNILLKQKLIITQPSKKEAVSVTVDVVENMTELYFTKTEIIYNSML